MGFLHCVLQLVSSGGDSRRQQPVLGANPCAERSPAMGILRNFFPFIPLCLTRLIKPLYAPCVGFSVVCSGVRTVTAEVELRIQAVFFSQNIFSHWRTNLHLSKISVKELLIYLPGKGMMAIFRFNLRLWDFVYRNNVSGICFIF